jgi:gliding motility-associated-like protein
VQPSTIDNSLNYFWSDGTVGPINTITFDGTYTLLATNKYCGASDSYTITSRLKPVLSSLGPDKDFCSNDSINILLDPITNYTAPPFLVLWSPGGQSTKSITVKKPGTYIIKVRNGLNCEASDTIKITSTLVPKPTIPDSLFICGAGSFTVNASCNAQNYLWSNGSKDSIIVITESGYYSVEASNGKCKASDLVFVDKLSPFTLGPDFEFCPENENPTIEISNNTDAFTWSNLDDPAFINLNPKRKLVVKKAGEYVASISRGTCTLHDTIEINTYKNQNVFVPNSFSPSDNNAVNPKYFIKATDVKDFNIKVFTRFGEVLFESSDPKFTWDGKNKKGERIMSGAYVYAISYKSYCSGDELFRENGILNVF